MAIGDGRRGLRRALARGSTSAEDEARARRTFELERADPDLVFRRYRDDLYRYCRLRCPSVADTEDVVAQVFTDALTALPRLRWQGRPVVALLYTIAARRLADLSRRRSPEPLAPDALPDLMNSSVATPELSVGPSLQAALLELPESQRLAIFLRVVVGYSVREVATVLDRSEKATEHLILRGLAQTRRALDAEAGAG